MLFSSTDPFTWIIVYACYFCFNAAFITTGKYISTLLVLSDTSSGANTMNWLQYPSSDGGKVKLFIESGEMKWTSDVYKFKHYDYEGSEGIRSEIFCGKEVLQNPPTDDFKITFDTTPACVKKLCESTEKQTLKLRFYNNHNFFIGEYEIKQPIKIQNNNFVEIFQSPHTHHIYFYNQK
jgi:hypothetical protein